MKNRTSAGQFSDKTFTALIDIIKAENDSLKLLSKNLEKQYQVLLNQQLLNFIDVLEEQRALVWEMQQKEDMRQEKLRTFLPELETLSLNDLIQSAPEQFKSELVGHKNEFDAYVEKIERMKGQNQRLIKKSLELIEQQMAVFRGFDQRGYNASGKIDRNEVNLISRQM